MEALCHGLRCRLSGSGSQVPVLDVFFFKLWCCQLANATYVRSVALAVRVFCLCCCCFFAVAAGEVFCFCCCRFFFFCCLGPPAAVHSLARLPRLQLRCFLFLLLLFVFWWCCRGGGGVFVFCCGCRGGGVVLLLLRGGGGFCCCCRAGGGSVFAAVHSLTGLPGLQLLSTTTKKQKSSNSKHKHTRSSIGAVQADKTLAMNITIMSCRLSKRPYLIRSCLFCCSAHLMYRFRSLKRISL